MRALRVTLFLVGSVLGAAVAATTVRIIPHRDDTATCCDAVMATYAVLVLSGIEPDDRAMTFTRYGCDRANNKEIQDVLTRCIPTFRGRVRNMTNSDGKQVGIRVKSTRNAGPREENART